MTSPPPAPSGSAAEPAWKVLLALLSLSLTALLWFQGLAGSLEQPSVNSDLELHQLELAALLQDRLPEPLAGWLLGEQPRARLATTLQSRIGGADPPAPLAHTLELALLQRAGDSGGSERTIRELVPRVEMASSWSQ